MFDNFWESIVNMGTVIIEGIGSAVDGIVDGVNSFIGTATNVLVGVGVVAATAISGNYVLNTNIIVMEDSKFKIEGNIEQAGQNSEGRDVFIQYCDADGNIREATKKSDVMICYTKDGDPIEVPISEYKEIEGKSVKDIRVGDYVQYLPEDKSITVEKEDTGYTSDQTFNISKDNYNEGWRVLYNNDGQLDIISAESVGTLTLKGKIGYAKAIGTLNKIANAWADGGEFAVKARNPGYGHGVDNLLDEKIDDKTITIENISYDDAKENSKYEDIFNSSEIELIRGHAPHTEENVWVASRRLAKNDEDAAFFVRQFKPGGVENNKDSVFDQIMYQDPSAKGQKSTTTEASGGIRPIISLHSGLTIVDGDGTNKDNPYVLSDSDIVAVKTGDNKVVYTRKNIITYYDAETNKPVDIIRSGDLSEGDIVGFVAVNAESSREVNTSIEGDVKITFQEEVLYKGSYMNEIVIKSSEMTNRKWETDIIEAPKGGFKNIVSEDGVKYVPIIITFRGVTQTIQYIPNGLNSEVSPGGLVEPSSKKWNDIAEDYMYFISKNISEYRDSAGSISIGDETTKFSVNFEPKNEYYAGDKISINGNACEHSLNLTGFNKVGEETQRVGEKRVIVCEYTHGNQYNVDYDVTSLYYDENGKYVTFKKLEDVIDYFDKKEIQLYYTDLEFLYGCSNDYKQDTGSVYYIEEETVTVPVFEETTKPIGALNCPVDITLKGFRVNGGEKDFEVKDGKVYVKSEDSEKTIENFIEVVNDLLSEASWRLQDLKIDEFTSSVLKEQVYDKDRGLSYGTITVSCDGNETVYKIYFGKMGEPNQPQDVPGELNPPQDVPGGHDIEFKANPPEAGKVPGNKSDVLPGEGVLLEVTPNEGWEFERWEFEEKGTGKPVYPEVGYDELTGEGLFIMPDKDITAIAVFEEKEAHDIDFEVRPSGAGEVPGNISDVFPGEEVELKVTPSGDWEFNHWEFEEDGKTIYPEVEYDKSTGEGYFIMPNKDITVIAVFEEEGPYTLTVSADPEDGGTVAIFGKGSQYSATYGEQLTVIANQNSEYIFKYWYVYEGGKKIPLSSNPEYSFSMPSEDTEMIAYFMKKDVPSVPGGGPDEPGTPDTPNKGWADSFRIVSVRDLNWKDYFTDSKGKLTGKYFNIPDINSTMIKNLGGKHSNVIKMGYAVEFELDTISVPYENAYLKITPKIINNGNDIGKEYIDDELKGEKIDSYFLDPIIIDAKSPDIDTKTRFMTSAEKRQPSIIYNGIDQHGITWRWIYYLPADISSKKFTNNKDVTIRMDIELYEKTSNKLMWKLSEYVKSKGSNWKGDVYKYSLTESLLNDIYDNATN